MNWSASAIEDVLALFEYLAEKASLWDAEYVTGRVLSSTDRLSDFPRLYEADSRYGEGVRRISTIGQNILYEVNDLEQVINVLAVVGQRQKSHTHPLMQARATARAGNGFNAFHLATS
ncbi:type II toxin-antitoxin system RelE/ParE family toxin [Comamonas nitrativorans]|uniref:Type II toxin-antitoxin system RelE/ParE family toxin n=1 Tax=Comamonas nitrativorans TaxID=108437 RepID=A0ABV9GTK0_9BURK